jgi:hypothetical protein
MAQQAYAYYTPLHLYNTTTLQSIRIGTDAPYVIKKCSDIQHANDEKRVTDNQVERSTEKSDGCDDRATYCLERRGQNMLKNNLAGGLMGAYAIWRGEKSVRWQR